MHFVHLTASTFYGGPERQILGLASHLPEHCRTTVVCFREGGRGREFQQVVTNFGHDAVELVHDTPRLFAAVDELAGLLRDRTADLLLCHGYKANLVGRLAARRSAIPAVAVSRGWTGENIKVRAYEWLDRRHLTSMDRVVCVSDGQAIKVRRAGVPADRVTVIHNAARPEAFADPDPSARRELLSLFPGANRVMQVVLAAGRLSPEKGFDVLVAAIPDVIGRFPRTGFVVFGEGPERKRLEQRVATLGLADNVVLPGFRRDLDRLLPAADILALSSHTEGLPNVVLEAAAAGVPVVATAVGGTPEVVLDGETGYLVPPADQVALADRLTMLLGSQAARERMGATSREFVRERFSFHAQADAYLALAHRLTERPMAELACS